MSPSKTMKSMHRKFLRDTGIRIGLREFVKHLRATAELSWRSYPHHRAAAAWLASK